MKLVVTSVVAVLCPALVCSAADTLTIERLAPENSVLVVNVKNINEFKAHLHSTGLWDLWQNEQVQNWLREPLQEMRKGLEEAMKEIGHDPDALICPAGHVGLAVSSVENEEFGAMMPAFTLLIDYGTPEAADKTAELMAAVQKQAEENGDLRIEEKQIGSRTVHTLIDVAMEKRQEEERIQAEEMDEEEEAWEDDFDTGPGIEDTMKNVHYLREGNAFIISTDMTNLTSALEGLDGKPYKNVTEQPDYAAVLDQVRHEDQDVTAVLLTEGLADVMGPEGETIMMMAPMLRPAFGTLNGIGFGMRLDADGAIGRQMLSLYMPDGKLGLAALLDTQTPRREVPRFVPADALTYSATNFEFGGVADFIKSFINGNPFLAQNAEDFEKDFEPTLRQICGSLGSEIHTASLPGGPAGASSTLAAFQCLKPQDFENAIATYAPQLGMEPRDFLGQRIYSMKQSFAAMMAPGMMPEGAEGEPISVGIGGGYAFFGPTSAVEQALRANTETGGATLNDDAGYQRAVAMLGGQDGIAWTYTNTIDLIEATVKESIASMDAQVAMIREWDEETANEVEASNREFKDFMQTFDWALLRRYIGPTAGQFRSTSDGFVMESMLLPAEITAAP